MERIGRAFWIGSLTHGYGMVSTQSGVLQNVRQSFLSRYSSVDDGPSTNPDELMAAGLAGCYTMAAALVLQHRGGVSSARLYSSATLELDDRHRQVTGLTLRLWAEVPGYTVKDVEQLAQQALGECILGLILNVPIRIEVMQEMTAPLAAKLLPTGVIS